jgi:hypothetical protein
MNGHIFLSFLQFFANISRWRGGTGGRVLSGRREADSVWTVLAGGGPDAASSFLLHDIREIEIWILRCYKDLILKYSEIWIPTQEL